jgi:hypothetical protein
MWKEAPPMELPKTSPTPLAGTNGTAKPLSEDEMRGILERLEATRDIFRENRELKSVLFRRETETKDLRARNAELEEIMRKFAPILQNAATTMGLAAKNENRDRTGTDN